MEYKGYKARVEFDAEASTLYGRIVGIRDVVDFQADSVVALEQEFRDSVDDYLDFCKQRGESPDRPYSGRFVFRTNSEHHRQMAGLAEQEGVSLNEWLEQLVIAKIQSPTALS